MFGLCLIDLKMSRIPKIHHNCVFHPLQAPSETTSTEASTKASSPPTTTSPTSMTSPSYPTEVISAPSLQSFMPLRDAIPVANQLLTTQSHPADNLSPDHVPAANSTRDVFHSTALDPGASTSGEYDQENEPRDLPHSLTSTPSSNHKLFSSFRNSRLETDVENPEVTAPLQVPQAGSPTTRLTAEGTSLSDQATSVSTMTPPMSPPKIKGLFSSGSNTKVRLAAGLPWEPHGVI